MSTSEEINKDLVEAYEDLRQQGDFNMVTEAYAVIEILDCSMEAYMELQAHYRDYCNKFGVEIG